MPEKRTTASTAARKAWVTRRNQTAAPVARLLDYGPNRALLLQTYRCLLQRADDQDLVEGLTVAELATFLKVSPRHAKRMLQQLADDGFVEIFQRYADPTGGARPGGEAVGRQRANAYRVVTSR